MSLVYCTLYMYSKSGFGGSSKKSKTVIPTIGILLLLGVIIVFLGRAVWSLYGRYDASIDRRERVEEEYASLRDRLDRMEAAVASFETPEGKEAVVRTSYNVAKEGEQVVIIVDKKQESVQETAPRPWYTKLWRGLWFIE